MTRPGAAGLSLPPGQDIKPLTGIRFFAAVWVLVFHFRDEIPQGTPVVDFFMPIILHGHYAVPMFFVLSGFILSHTYFGRYRLSSHGDFVYLRFARLWPVHVASIIGLLLYLRAHPESHKISTCTVDNFHPPSLGCTHPKHIPAI